VRLRRQSHCDRAVHLGGRYNNRLLENLLTEQPNPASEGIDRQSTEAVVRIINNEDHRVAASLVSELGRIAEAVDGIVARIRAGGRLFYIGAGTSGRLGVLDAAECRPTFQVPEELVQGIIAGGERALARATEASEDSAQAGAADLMARGFRAGDALVGIAASGRTPYVLGAVQSARAMGALTVGISCTPDSELARAVEISIAPLPGPEVIAGSTRMKAGTATKLVLNTLSTAVMIRLGYVYGNRMVNVAPTNEKLRARAERIVSEIANVDGPRAAALLREAGDNVRVAILMGIKQWSRMEAEHKLESAGGRLGELI
jgi:N-acetylmuramic acid 6-phosphate etherase